MFKSNPDYSDNPRALYEYMDRLGTFDLCWIVTDAAVQSLLVAKGIAAVMEDSVESRVVRETADVLVSTSFDHALEKQPNQLFVSTWHGFPLKLIGFYESAASSSDELLELRTTTDLSDVIVATSRSCQILMAGMFVSDPRKVAITGYPRVDIMLNADSRSNLFEVLPDCAEDDALLLLYMPTVRRGLKDEGDIFQDNIFNYPDYDPTLLDQYLESKNAYLIAKLHFADNDVIEKDGFVLPQRMKLLDTKDLTNKLLTIYHILSAFDLLITDYSSIFTEYMLLDKPVVFSCPDFEKYEADRGFVVDDPTMLMPGPIVKTQAELISKLEEILVEDNYSDCRNNLKKYFHSFVDDQSSMRLCKVITDALSQRLPDCNKDFSFQFLDSGSPLSFYTGRCVAQFFFDVGNGIIEPDSIRVEYNLNSKDDDGYIKICIDVPSDFCGLARFDPDDSNRLILNDFSASLQGKTPTSILHNGEERDEMLVFKTRDPYIFLEFDESISKRGGTLEVRFRPVVCAYEGANLIYNEIEEIAKLDEEVSLLKSELSSIYNSKSWKLTKPFRRT